MVVSNDKQILTNVAMQAMARQQCLFGSYVSISFLKSDMQESLTRK